jgi:serine protease Do
MNKQLLFSGLIALMVTVATIGAYDYWKGDDGKTIKIEHVDSNPAQKVLYTIDEEGDVIPVDFTQTAEKVTSAVVHIRSSQTVTARGQDQNANPFFDDDLFRRFFGDPAPQNQQRGPQVRMGSGSGVIIDPSGYIITNNHVIADADDLEITLNDNRSYKARVIGTDPTTDLAVIKIDEENLPTLGFVDSDKVKIGEWVMAVGNPFNLTSTVTAGIVSAKARSINILREQYAVESFIQTDAAINPGNSGGALVNLSGGLIGINTAIASPTGSYSGYGFAVPANIVQKVVKDLIEFGVVQRGVLGVMIRSVNSNLAKEEDLDINTGAYVDSLLDNSAAAAGGIKPGDVIIGVEGQPVTSSSELQELIARHRPGDEVAVTVNRKGKEKAFKVVLNNRSGNTEVVVKQSKEVSDILGAELEDLDAGTARKLDIRGGVKVTELTAGKLRNQTQMQEGFIITKVNGKTVATVDELKAALEGKTGGVMLEGVYVP